MTGCLSREVLSALLDGECDPDERRYAHSHMSECDDCREAAHSFSQVRDLVAGLPRMVAPQEFVASALTPGSSPRRLVRDAFRGPRRYAAVAVAVAVAAVSLAGIAAPPEPEQAPVEVFVNRHVSVNDGSNVGGQVLFAVSGR